jgi:hypothetical protein
MKTEIIVWLVFLLIGAALAGWLGALIVGVLWLAYALGIARAVIQGTRRFDAQGRKR